MPLDATPTPTPAIAEDGSDIIFTGNEKRQQNDDGSWSVWQEYQFGKGGPTTWIQRGQGAPTNIKS